MAINKTNQRAVMLVCDYSLSYLGGAQVAFIRQVQALLGEGWSVTVVAPNAAKAFKENGSPLLSVIEPSILFSIPVLELPVLRRTKKLESRIKSLLAGGRFDAVIAHSEFGLAAAAMRAAKDAGVQIFQTVHTFFWRAPRAFGFVAPLVTLWHTKITKLPRKPFYGGSTKINNALRSMTLRFGGHVDHVLSPSRHQAVALEKAGLMNVTALSNVSQPVTGAPPSVNKHDSDTIKIVWAGRFAPEKRLNIALRAAKIAAAVLAEDGGFAAEDSGQVFELHVAGGELESSGVVRAHGRITSAEVSRLIEEAHAVLITSVGFDNQPMLALEGFAKHRPVIVTDPILSEEFGDAAILTDDETAEGLGATIVRLVKHPQKLADAGAFAGDYARQRTPAKHAYLIDSLIGKGMLD